MKIKFLGTSAGWPIPRLGHHCELCDSRDPKDKRLHASVLVNDFILIDAGPDIYQKLLRVSPTKIKYVLLTHWHPDHTVGVWELSHIYAGKETRRIKPIIFGTKPTIKFINASVNQKSELETREIEFEEEVKLGNLKFFNFSVKHTEGSIAVCLKEGNTSFVYIPDFKTIPQENLKFAQEVDLLVMDGSSLTHIGETPAHQTIEQGIKLAKNLKIKQAAFTHLGHDTDRHVNLEEFVKRNGGKNFFVPYDGLKVEL